MTRPGSFTTCPFKPPVDPARLINPTDPIGVARLPSHACDRERCQLWMRAMDRDGRLVGEYCAIVGIVAGLGQVGSIMLAFVPHHETAHVGPNNSPPPTA